MLSESVILIPSRLASTRLPNKPLALIKGKSLIQHVVEKAIQTNIDTYVVTDSVLIKDNIKNYNCIMTPELSSGTERILYAIKDNPNLFKNKKYFINLQGDMPFIEPEQILQILEPLKHYEMSTLVYDMEPSEYNNPNSVKAIVHWNNNIGRAHWFTRANINYGYHHAGIYGFTRTALMAFANKTELETKENLEQLRAICNGIEIGVYKTTPIAGEINTPEDLEKANL